MSRNKQTKKTKTIKSRRGVADSVSRSPRQVEHYWNFYKKGLYVSKPVSRLPGWLLPLLATLLIIALVFWGIPQIISRIQNSQTEPTIPEEQVNDRLYGPQTRVVIKPVADLFDQPDLKAKRITQLLYQETVTRLDVDCPPGFIAVEFQETVTGYMLIDDLTEDCSAIEPADYEYRAVVTAPTKRVMSHAEKGTLLIEVMMGTQLFIDYRGAGVSSVRLSDGTTGWISEDSVVILPSNAAIEMPFEPADAFCHSALIFLQTTALDYGMSIRGMSVEGIVHLAARINGLTVPRTVEGLLTAGVSLPLVKDPETGHADISQLKRGDLIFFAEQAEQQPRVGILIQTNQVLYTGSGQTSIRLIDLEREDQLKLTIKGARRIFP